MKFVPDVYVLPLTNEHGTVFLTLLTGKGHTVLVDTGHPDEFKQLEAALEAEGFSVADLTDIVITHHDIDHIGCIKDLLAANPQIKVSTSKNETPYLEGTLEPEKVARMWMDFGSLPSEAQQFFFQLEQAFKNRRISVDRQLVNHEMLPFAGGVEVVETPGHTKGHIALYVKNRKVLIAGDALRVVDGRLALPDKELANNYVGALDAVRRISKYNIDAVICYHGGTYRSKDMTTEIMDLLDAEGAIAPPVESYSPPVVDLGIVPTSPADGDNQVFGEGEFPAALDHMNFGAWLLSFIWGLAYALPVWAVLLFLMLIVDYAVGRMVGSANLSPQIASALSLLISAGLQVPGILFGFYANRLAWKARSKKLANLMERAPSDKMVARNLVAIREKTVGRYKKTAENWFFVWGAYFVLNTVVTFFELAPTPADTLDALKSMASFAVTPTLILIVWVIDRKRRGRGSSSAGEANVSTTEE